MSNLVLVHPNHAVQKLWDGITVCACCYCGAMQEVAPPPALHHCEKCGRGFRVYRNYSGVKVEMGKDAKKFFELKEKSA